MVIIYLTSPMLAAISGAFGLIGICWGWRNDNRLPWSAVAFVVWLFMWGYACLIIAPVEYTVLGSALWSVARKGEVVINVAP